ncbi:Zn-dependent hydrolase [Natrialba sp. SSL1]|nr:Zn-dependent hydrolase [Natrialba sp. SSL1]
MGENIIKCGTVSISLKPMVQVIDRDRIERRLDDLWEIGQTQKGGVTRLAYTDEESDAFSYIRTELSSSYSVTEDSMGNLFATREPEASDSIYIGSHLDSVYNGGRLDGTLGVVTAIEAIEAVYSSECEPAHPPTLAIFRNEESARFGQHTVGSRGALGQLEVEDFSATDQNDVPLWHAMQSQGFEPENLSNPTINTERITGFLELHIEQGRVLDERELDVGLVTSIRAPVRCRVTVTGDHDHSGATPMELRCDALSGAAEMITAIESVATTAATDGDLVATVGDITTVNGAINKVCGEVSFPIDIRSKEEDYRDTIENRIVDTIETIADDRELRTEIELLDRSEPVQLDSEFVTVLEQSAETSGAAYCCLPSGGGHDAMNFQLAGIPTGMVFVPSINGISHNPAEATKPEAIEKATRILSKALVNFEE